MERPGLNRRTYTGTAPRITRPVDRFIVATALTIGATVVTKDRRIRRHPPVESV